MIVGFAVSFTDPSAAGTTVLTACHCVADGRSSNETPDMPRTRPLSETVEP